MSLTPDQLEVAARKLCEVEGVTDADELSGGIPKWKYYVPLIRRQDRIADAIAHARGPATFNMDGTATVTALAIARGETAGEQRKTLQREPTAAMMLAAHEVYRCGQGVPEMIWRAMWDAYQEPTK